MARTTIALTNVLTLRILDPREGIRYLSEFAAWHIELVDTVSEEVLGDVTLLANSPREHIWNETRPLINEHVSGQLIGNALTMSRATLRDAWLDYERRPTRAIFTFPNPEDAGKTLIFLTPDDPEAPILLEGQATVWSMKLVSSEGKPLSGVSHVLATDIPTRLWHNIQDLLTREQIDRNGEAVLAWITQIHTDYHHRLAAQRASES